MFHPSWCPWACNLENICANYFRIWVTDPPASTSQVLELWACVTMPSSTSALLKFFTVYPSSRQTCPYIQLPTYVPLPGVRAVLCTEAQANCYCESPSLFWTRPRSNTHTLYKPPDLPYVIAKVFPTRLSFWILWCNSTSFLPVPSGPCRAQLTSRTLSSICSSGEMFTCEDQWPQRVSSSAMLLFVLR